MERLTLEELLAGEVQRSLLNEPVTPEPPRETPTEKALRRWFRQDPTVENCH